MEGVHALGDDPALDPLDHVAGGTAGQQADVLEKRVLHQRVQLERKINRSPDQVRLLDQAQVGIGRTDQFKDEIQAVDQNEMADPELARVPLTKVSSCCK